MASSSDAGAGSITVNGHTQSEGTTLQMKPAFAIRAATGPTMLPDMAKPQWTAPKKETMVTP